ncbi:MAG: Hint domain-containing protein [Candidatus Babeliales bacterium]
MSSHKISFVFAYIVFLKFACLQAGFVEGTLVKTLHGFIPIEALQINDEVYCFDESTNEFALRTIIEITCHEVSTLIHIQTNANHILTDTQQSFFLPIEKAWRCAPDLIPETILQSCYKQQIVVKNVNQVHINAVIYDLTLEAPHTFCVTPSGIVAHNFMIVIPITLGVMPILKAVAVGAATYLVYDFVAKNTHATTDMNLDISNSNLFDSINPLLNSPGHCKGSVFETNKDSSVRGYLGNENNSSNAVFAHDPQSTKSQLTHYDHKKLPRPPSVHDTRSFPIPKFDDVNVIGCGTGLLPAPQGLDDNIPSCLQESRKSEERFCGTTLRMPSFEDINANNPTYTQEINDGESYTCGTGLQPIAEPITSCNWSKNPTKFDLSQLEVSDKNQINNAHIKRVNDSRNHSKRIDERSYNYSEDSNHQTDKTNIGFPIKTNPEITLEETIAIIQALSNQNPEKIWLKITPTQELYNPHSLIPKSFVINVDGQLIWVSPNASEHIMENTSPRKNDRPYMDPQRSPWDIPAKEYKLSHELLLNDFYEAIQEAIKSDSGIEYGKLIIINSWELIFGYPRVEDGHPALFHAFKKK